MCRKVLLALVVLNFYFVPSALGQEDPTVRGRKVSEWFKFLRSEKDARRRLAALQILDSEAGPKVGIVLPGLIKELREHPDAAIRSRIADYLVKYKELGDDALNALKAALASDKEGKVREQCAISIGRLDRQGFSAVPELTTALKDKDAATRAAAAEALGVFSKTDPEIAKESISALVECLKDADAQVRLQTVFTLGRMGMNASSAATGLAQALGVEKDVAIRKELIKTLAGLGDKAGEASDLLIHLLRDPRVEIRQAAAVAVGRVNPDVGRAIPELLKSARDADKAVRCFAIHSAGALGLGLSKSNPGKLKELKLIPELIEILKNDVTADVRLAAIEELAGFGADAKEAVDALTVASKDGRAAVRDAATEALKKVRPNP